MGITWLIRVQRTNFLCKQTKPLFIQPVPDFLYPGHLHDALNQFGIAGRIDLNAIAAFLFRHVASHIGRP